MPIFAFISRSVLILSLLATATTHCLVSTPNSQNLPIIRNIVIEGNTLITESAIKNTIAHRGGNYFRESDSTASIQNLCAFGSHFGEFESAQILQKPIENNKVDIKVVVEEKKSATQIDFEGNFAITTKKLGEVLNVKNIRGISPYDVELMKIDILKEYRTNNYLDVSVDAEITDTETNKCTLLFNITEGKKTILSKVNFRGCEQLPSHQLRNNIATKEDWVFSFVDQSGKFSKDVVDIDQKRIEQQYRDAGFLNASARSTIEHNEQTNSVVVTFDIEEGPQSEIRYITLPSDDEFSSTQIKRALAIHRGSPCSTAKISKTTENMKMLLGSKGYIFADAYYDIRPVNDSYEQVDVWFFAEKGKKYTINDIIISGNKKTKDHVLLRELAIEPEQIANRARIEMSKSNLERTGYFAKDEVDWKPTPISEDKVDLEFNVREVKTGKGTLSLAYAPEDRGSQESSIRLVFDARKRNIFGQGWDLGAGLQFGKNNLRHADLEVASPYLFDQNVSAATNAYYDKHEYSEMGVDIKEEILEKTLGISSKLGFALFPQSTQIRTVLEAGIEDIKSNSVIFNKKNADVKEQTLGALSSFQRHVRDEKFRSGVMAWIGYSLLKDTKDHELYPTSGWKVEWNQKFALPAMSSSFSMIKTELTGQYYFPLLPKGKLTFAARGKVGMIGQFSDDKPIPFKELYHVGGPNSLRGFRWNEAGPHYIPNKMPLGAKAMALASLELIVPLGGSAYDITTPRGYVFYDMGGGWLAPTPDEATFAAILSENKATKRSEVFHDQLQIRHTIGCGIKLSAPTAITVEWGYKLDRKSLSGERPSETHISMNMPF